MDEKGSGSKHSAARGIAPVIEVFGVVVFFPLVTNAQVEHA